MTVYILSESIASHHFGESCNVIGVYDSESKVKAKIESMVKAEVEADDFFMRYMLVEPKEDRGTFDVCSINEDYVHLYCDGNGDEYNLYYSIRTVE